MIDSDTLAQLFTIAREAARIENEACAQIAERMGHRDVAQAIRERGDG